MYHNGVEYIDYEAYEGGGYVTDEGKCSECGWPIEGFEDLEKLDFQVEESGVAPGTADGYAVHWANGSIACPVCKERLYYEVSS